jgi:cell shape-determining protein MreC
LGEESFRILANGKKKILTSKQSYYLLSPKLAKQNFDNKVPIELGTIARTSGLDGIYFSDIPVAKVSRINPLELSPIADILNVREVLVVVE